jgi:hypothetical protein
MCILKEVEISGDRNVIKREVYNRNSVMQNVKEKVITVKKGATGTISKHSKNT